MTPESTGHGAVPEGLPVPGRETVRHALREVEYGERLVIHRMTVGQGTSAIDIYSFADLTAHMFGTEWNRLEVTGSRANLIWVEPEKLTAWLRDVLGDAEFASALTDAMTGPMDYKSWIETVYPLFVERARQYEAALLVSGDQE